MKNYLPLMLLFIAACVGTEQGVSYRPAPQILPSHIKRLAVRPVQNRTQQFGLEDKLTRRVVDEFLRDGNFPIGQESESDGVVASEVTRYILTPVTYDTALVPTSYKLTVISNLKFFDRITNTMLWEEPNMVVSVLYAPSTVPGGKTESQAQEDLWNILSKEIVDRVIKGFGSAMSESTRRIAPSTGTTSQPIPSTGTLPSDSTDQPKIPGITTP